MHKKPTETSNMAAWSPYDDDDGNGPVDGGKLLDRVERFAGGFLAFPTAHHLVVLCLWVLHTWVVSAFYVTRACEFPVFAPVALARLAGKMPATITDRAITMHMRRRSSRT